MSNINESTSREDFSHYYFRLVYIGNAMFAYYDGESLTEYQMKLIAESSYKEKVLGMDLVASKRLIVNNYENYNVFANNSTAIKLAKKRSK